MSTFLHWVAANKESLGVVIPFLVAVVSALWSFLSYMDLKKREVREKQLHLYHDLVKRLVSPESSGITKLDSQMALVFELTNFPAYYPVTERILCGLRKQWTHPRILEEMDVAIAVIRKKLKKPNKALEPTTTAVTPPAAQEPRQP